MLAAHLSPLAAAVFSLLVIGSLLLTFVMLGSRWLKDYMLAFGAQSWLIGILSALIGYYGGYHELYAVAVLTVLFRGLVLPWLIMRILRKLPVRRELYEIVSPSSSLLIGAALVIFAFLVAKHITATLGLKSDVVVLALTVMFSMKLIGFQMLTLRHEAISHILGIMVLENGIFLGSQILVPGMPLMIELVLLFDLLVAVACFGVLIRYLLAQIGSTSSRELTRLTG
jgi:hydrogenase-4 component E